MVLVTHAGGGPGGGVARCPVGMVPAAAVSISLVFNRLAQQIAGQ